MTKYEVIFTRALSGDHINNDGIYTRSITSDFAPVGGTYRFIFTIANEEADSVADQLMVQQGEWVTSDIDSTEPDRNPPQILTPTSTSSNISVWMAPRPPKPACVVS